MLSFSVFAWLQENNWIKSNKQISLVIIFISIFSVNLLFFLLYLLKIKTMNAVETYREHFDEATELYDIAVNDLNEIYESKKDEYSATPGLLKDILNERPLKNEFTDKYSSLILVLEDSNGNRINNSTELDSLIYKMYLDLVTLPETLTNQLL
jgi:hypothetical protein